VAELLQKLKLLRKNQAITGMTGRTMYAAVSGITVSPKARDLALSHGIYVMTMHEDEDRVDVVAPAKKGTW
jgi:SpoU rRNA methylase family enzyme